MLAVREGLHCLSDRGKGRAARQLDITPIPVHWHREQVARSRPKLEFSPQAFSSAESAAARDAARLGKTSYCGAGIPADWIDEIASGDITLVVAGRDERTFAACLHDEGYLTAAELDAALRWADDQTWRWWEKGLWFLGLLAVVTATAWRLFGRRPAAAEIPG